MLEPSWLIPLRKGRGRMEVVGLSQGFLIRGLPFWDYSTYLHLTLGAFHLGEPLHCLERCVERGVRPGRIERQAFLLGRSVPVTVGATG